MRPSSEKIKLSKSQRRLIRFNISQHLKFDALASRHHGTFASLESKEIFFINENCDAQFTEEAVKRLLNAGIDIDGNEVIRYLRLDPLFLESKKCLERWEDRCRKPSPRTSAKVRIHDELSEEIYEKYEDSILNSECLSTVLIRQVDRFMNKIKIPKEI